MYIIIAGIVFPMGDITNVNKPKIRIRVFVVISFPIISILSFPSRN